MNSFAQNANNSSLLHIAVPGTAATSVLGNIHDALCAEETSRACYSFNGINQEQVVHLSHYLTEYLAWVGFVLTTTNTLAAASNIANQEFPQLRDWPDSTMSVLLFTTVIPLLYYLWWIWK